jgi:hypothetical protein
MSAAAYWIFHCATHLFSWPYDYYVTWIKLYNQGFRGGEVNSLLFELALFYFCVVFSSSEGGTRLRSWFFLAGIIPFGYAFLTASLLWGFLSGLLFAAGFFLPLIFGPDKKSSPVLKPLSAIFAVLLGLSFLLSWVSWPDVSANYKGTVLHPFLQKLIRGIFSDIPYFADNYMQYSSGGSSVEMYGYPARSSRPLASVTWRPGAVLYLRNTVSTDFDPNYQWLPSTREGLTPLRTQTGLPGEYITIQVLEDFTHMALSRLDSDAIISVNAIPYDGTSATGFRFLEPVRNNTVYALSQSQADPSPPDPAYLASALDTDGSLAVAKIFNFLPFKSDDNEKFLNELSDYYSENFSYTLNPDIPGTGTNPLEHFFFTARSGYCTQFATTTALLCRAKGIPARFVSGFLVVIPPDQDNCPILSYNAHSWVEIYMEGKGWVTLETTPVIRDLTEGRFEEYFRQILNLDNDTRVQLSTVSQIESPMNEKGKNSSVPLRFLFVLASLIATGLIAYSFIRLSRKPEYPFPPAARHLQSRLAALWKKSALPQEKFSGWLFWLLGKESGKKIEDPDIPRNLLLRTLYAGHKLSPEEKRRTEEYLRQLCD